MADAPDLPSPPHFPDLASGRDLALFLDFDGTLVDIAPTPDAIAVPPDLSTRLRRLAARLEGRLALVTGRSPENLASHCRYDGIACAGSHGAVRFSADGELIGGEPDGLPEGVTEELLRFASDHGVSLESKAHGAALHYRSSPDMQDLVIRGAERLASENGLQAKQGKCVVELVRPGADKGGAVRAFMKTAPFAGGMPVFVGDDVTDEDGFVACAELGGHAVIVGDRQQTVARYRLRSVAHVYEWLGL